MKFIKCNQIIKVATLQNHFLFLILAIAPLILSACGSGENRCGGVIAISIPKVTLAATDTNGNKLTNFVIAYQTNSRSGSKTLTCDFAEGCDLQFAGEGDIAITVSKVGYESVSLKTSIQLIDGCGNTNIERLSVKLKPL